MTKHPYQERLEKCSRLMKAAGLDVLLLTKPVNMFYLTGDGLVMTLSETGQVKALSADGAELLSPDKVGGFLIGEYHLNPGPEWEGTKYYGT